MKTVKRSVAVVVRKGPVPGGAGAAGGPAPWAAPAGPVLAVRRPPDDEDLPGAWGLPAASLREGESWEDAVRRAGREKLGVRLRPGPLLREGQLEREAYVLHMRLYGAEIAAGEPEVPQEEGGVTQYTAWAWAPVERLRPAARLGSLCSRLCLAWAGGED